MPTALLVESVARALSHLIDESPAQSEAQQVFDSARIPRISVEEYLERLHMTFQCCDSSFIGAVVLLDRLLLNRRLHGCQPQRLTAWNVHRLFLTCLVASVKYHEDHVCGNRHYAKAGGVQAKELASMERFLLKALDFDLRVRPEQFWSYACALRALGATRSAVPQAPAPRAESARRVVDSAVPKKSLGSGAAWSSLGEALLRCLPLECLQFCSALRQEVASSLSAALLSEEHH